MVVSDPGPSPDPEVLFVSVHGPTTGGRRIATLSLRDDSSLITRGSNPRFVAPSTLVILQRDALVAAPLDPHAMTLAGPEQSLAHAETERDGLTIWGQRPFGAVTPGGDALFPIDPP